MKQLYQDRQYTKYIEDLIEKNEIPWDTDTLVDMFTYIINKSILQEIREKENMEEINKTIQDLSAEQRTQFENIMYTLGVDMSGVKMESIRMGYEGECAAASALLNC